VAHMKFEAAGTQRPFYFPFLPSKMMPNLMDAIPSNPIDSLTAS